MPPPPAALVDRLADAIQAEILSGEHPFGSRLRQEALAAHYGVSRTPVREALRKLQATELVELHPQRGAVVRGPSPRAVHEAYQIRAELEALAVELALPHIGAPERAELRAAVAQLPAAFDGDAAQAWRHAGERVRAAFDGDAAEAWRQADERFHAVLLRAAGNDRLRRTIADLQRLFPRTLTWTALRARPRLLAESLAEHRRILQAIESDAPSTARLAMAYHVHRAGERARAALTAPTAGPGAPRAPA